MCGVIVRLVRGLDISVLIVMTLVMEEMVCVLDVTKLMSGYGGPSIIDGIDLRVKKKTLIFMKKSTKERILIGFTGFIEE